MNRISTLDGWRGVAILMVIIHHVAFYSPYRQVAWAQLGSLGVDIFFVVSGYIITAKLLQERDGGTRIDLPSFYRRRAFRILPVTRLYLIVVMVLASKIAIPDYRAADVWASVFFTRNYLAAAGPSDVYTTHFWSLSIEEQFYLFWPAVLAFSNRSRALWIALSGAGLCAAWRLYSTMFLPVHPAYVYRTDLRCDGLLIGCGLAVLMSRSPVREFIAENAPKEMPLVLATFLMMMPNTSRGYPTLCGYLLIAGMIACTLQVQEGLAYKWLNSPALVWVGKISFSLYVWQQLFLLRPWNSGPQFGVLSEFPVNLVCSFAIAAASYYLLERPAVRFGQRCARGRVEQPGLLLTKTANRRYSD